MSFKPVSGHALAEIAKRDAEIVRLRSELDHLRGWREGVEPGIAKLKARVAELEAELDERDAEIRALHEENARLEGALLDLFSDMSLPMHDDQRYRDVTVQIDRETYERTKALLLDGEP